MSRVVARFAYWQEGVDEIPAYASYIIVESDHPKLPVGGNVDGEQLLSYGVPLPVTPTFQTWVNQGRPVYRGERNPHVAAPFRSIINNFSPEVRP